VLELTDELREENETVPVPIDNVIAFDSVDEPQRESPAMQAEDLISDTTRGAMGRAFAPLENMEQPSGALEAIFTRAVQDAFGPTLQEWVDHHQDHIMDQLKPMIRAWMDEHLPHLIELAVQKEISRAVPTRRR
jgi:cell pole-organizing protein PopZ